MLLKGLGIGGGTGTLGGMGNGVVAGSKKVPITGKSQGWNKNSTQLETQTQRQTQHQTEHETHHQTHQQTQSAALSKSCVKSRYNAY